ncbi:MAG: hypothetical protein HZB56_13925 [Deltaproteobacteria bacterium]|nr:hypothetical protein [Deltaproteobacteria bacterium]
MTRLAKLLVPMLLAGAGACAPSVKVLRTKPAEINLAGLNQLAIVEVTGSDGHQLGNDLTEAIFKTNRFKLVERSALDKIVREQRMSNASGLFAEGAKVGELLPASGLVAGQASHRVRDEVSRKNTTCTTEVNKKKVQVPCVEYTRDASVTYDASLKLLDTRTGRLLATRAFHKIGKDKSWATDEEPAAIDTGALLIGCRQEVVGEFVRMIAPFQVQEEVVLAVDDALPTLAAGNGLAKHGEWEAAVEQYGMAVAKAGATPGLEPKSRGKAHYSLGLGLVMMGRYDDGLAELRKAVTLHGDDDWAAFMQRAKAWKADAEKLQKQTAGL